MELRGDKTLSKLNGYCPITARLVEPSECNKVSKCL